MFDDQSVEITHLCGHVLGVFVARDDHGCVGIICPKCKGVAYLHNQSIRELYSDAVLTFKKVEA